MWVELILGSDSQSRCRMLPRIYQELKDVANHRSYRYQECPGFYQELTNQRQAKEGKTKKSPTLDSQEVRQLTDPTANRYILFF